MHTKNYFLLFFAYFFPLAIGLNFFLRYQANNTVTELKLYEKLYEIGYYKELFNPYQKSAILDLHPTNYFSLPKSLEARKKINNKVLTLNNDGFRFNPYNEKGNSEKRCILFLGSSAAFGVGTSSDKLTIPAIINKKLGNEYSIYNLSIPSWNSRQELISLLNFLNNDQFKNCSKLDTISFTGTSDLNGIDSLKKSSFYKDINLRKDLYSATEYFPILEENADLAFKTKNNLRFNLKMVINNSIKILFGEFLKIYGSNNNLENENNIKNISNKQNVLNDEYLNGQLNSFVINQKIISSIIDNLGGNHLLVLQPNLKNSKKNEFYWSRKNEVLSNLIKKEDCLNIIDLRNEFNKKQPKYKYKNELIPLSLSDAIKFELFKKDELKKHFFFDNAHLTNAGNLEVSKIIYESYLRRSTKKKCFSALIPD